MLLETEMRCRGSVQGMQGCKQEFKNASLLSLSMIFLVEVVTKEDIVVGM